MDELIDLVVTKTELEIIVRALTQRPWAEVNQLIVKIQKQLEQKKPDADNT